MTKRKSLIFPLVLPSSFRYYGSNLRTWESFMLKKVGLVIASVVFSGSALAGGLGVVDMNKVVKSVPQVKVMQRAIQQKFQPRQKKIVAMQKKFQRTQAKLKKNQAVMSKSALNKAAQGLQAQAQGLQTAQMSFQKDLVAAQNGAMRKFFAQVKLVAAKLAAKKKLDAILPANGLLYSAPGVDFTKQVINALRK